MKSYLFKHKWKIIGSIIIFWVLIPLIINLAFKINAVTSIFAAEWSAGDVLSFYGSIIAAVVTIIGVYITIDYSRKNFDEDEMNRIRPYMALTHYKFRARKALLGNNTPVETENQGDFYEEYKLERIYIVLNESSIEIKDKLEKDQLDILMSGGMHWESGSNGRAALRSYPYISYPFKVENVGCGAAINTVIGFCEEQKPRRGVSVFTLKPGDSAYLHIFCEDAKKIGNKRYVLDFSYYDTRGNGYSQKFLLNLYYDAYTDTAKGTIDLAGDQVSLL